MYKIAITGPESTGKSSLAEALASHYNTLWVPEFAREYLAEIDRDYNPEDIIAIAKGQYNSEIQTAKNAHKIIFCDTEFIVLKIWLKYRFDITSEWIEDKVKNHRYDLYLLMDIDIEWVFDPLREHPEKREYFFDLFKSELQKNQLNYRIISGTGIQRNQNAINAIDDFLNKK